MASGVTTPIPFLRPNEQAGIYRPIYSLLPELKPGGFLGVFGDSPFILNDDQRPQHRCNCQYQDRTRTPLRSFEQALMARGKARRAIGGKPGTSVRLAEVSPHPRPSPGFG